MDKRFLPILILTQKPKKSLKHRLGFFFSRLYIQQENHEVISSYESECLQLTPIEGRRVHLYFTDMQHQYSG